MAFIPQWIKKIGVRPRSIFATRRFISIVPLEANRSPDTLALAISSPRIRAKVGAKRKKNLMSPQRFLKNNVSDEFHRRLAYILRCTDRRKSCSPRANPTE
jgi:hypothetical protein